MNNSVLGFSEEHLTIFRDFSPKELYMLTELKQYLNLNKWTQVGLTMRQVRVNIFPTTFSNSLSSSYGGHLFKAIKFTNTHILVMFWHN